MSLLGFLGSMLPARAAGTPHASEDKAKGRAWAGRVYSEKLANPATLPNLGRGYSNELRAARAVLSIAEKKMFASLSAGRKQALPMPSYQRAFWQGVLDRAGELAIAASEIT